MANRYLVYGGDGYWSSTSNWSTTSGGAGGASVPTVGDTVYVDGSSPNVTMDVDANIADLLITPYYLSGFVLLNGRTLTITNSFYVYYGYWNRLDAPSGKVIFDGNVNMEVQIQNFYDFEITAGSTVTMNVDNLFVLNSFTALGTADSRITLIGNSSRLNSLGTNDVQYVDASNVRAWFGPRVIDRHGTLVNCGYWRTEEPTTVHITTAEQLLSLDPANSAVLENDIDMTNYEMRSMELLLDFDNDVTDSSGQGTPTTNTDVTFTAAATGFGQCGVFNGTSSYVYVEWGPNFALDDGTVDMRVKFTDTPTGPMPFFFDAQMSVGPYWTTFSFEPTSGLTGILRAYYNEGVGRGFDMSCPFTIELNRWYHLAFIRNGEHIKISVDGIFQTMTGTDVGTQFWQGFFSGMYIGKDLVAGTYFKGEIDEYRIVNYAAWTEDFTPPSAPYVKPLTPIGSFDDPFTGNFDGQGHTISNLTCIDYYGNYAALFGTVGAADNNMSDGFEPDPIVERVYAATPPEIHDLTLSNVTLYSGYAVGALVGVCYGMTVYNVNVIDCVATSVNGYGIGGLGGDCYGYAAAPITVTNCSVTNAVINSSSGGTWYGSSDFGGLFGAAYIDGNRTDCVVSNCRVINVSLNGADGNGDYGFGGIAGYIEGTISKCYATGSITNVNYNFGGFCGQSDEASIVNCYSKVNVTGDTDSSYEFGGFMGSYSYGHLDIINCYSSGSVTGDENSSVMGGFIGEIDFNDTYNAYTLNMVNCYSVGIVSPNVSNSSSGGFIGWLNITAGTPTITNCWWYTGSFTEAIGLSGSVYMSDSSAIDTVNGYVYYLLSGERSVFKFQMSDMTLIDTLPVTTESGRGDGQCCVIDTTNGFLYITWTAANHVGGVIYKIDLSTFTVVGSITTSNYLRKSLIDVDGGYLYVGHNGPGSGWPYAAWIWKIDLSTFTVVDEMSFVSHFAPYIMDAVMDVDGGNMYWSVLGSDTDNSISSVHKVSLSTFSATGSVDISDEALEAGCVASGFLYVGSGTGGSSNPSVIYKIDTSTMTLSDTLTLNTSEMGCKHMIPDVANDLIYLVVSQNIDLISISSFSEVSSSTINGLIAMEKDDSGYLYTAVNSTSSHVSKIIASSMFVTNTYSMSFGVATLTELGYGGEETDNTNFYYTPQAVYAQGNEGEWDFSTPIWHTNYLDYPDFVGSAPPGPTNPVTFDGDEIYYDEADTGISTGINFDVAGTDPALTMDPDNRRE